MKKFILALTLSSTLAFSAQYFMTDMVVKDVNIRNNIETVEVNPNAPRDIIINKFCNEAKDYLRRRVHPEIRKKANFLYFYNQDNKLFVNLKVFKDKCIVIKYNK